MKDTEETLEMCRLYHDRRKAIQKAYIEKLDGIRKLLKDGWDREAERGECYGKAGEGNSEKANRCEGYRRAYGDALLLLEAITGACFQVRD